MKTILAVEDDPLEAAALGSVLAPEFRIVNCAAGEEAPEWMARERPAAVLFDLGRAPEGLELLGRLAAEGRGVPVIAMSERADPRAVIEAVRHGAADFLAKPLRLEELTAALAGAMAPSSTSPFVGSSPACARCAERLHKYARYDYPVLVTGESGTGKDLAARAIHELSHRAAQSFVARNCAAFPEHLIESELFGSARGAFTGAVERPGAFELAAGGTLFLDEIGEAGLAVQAKLLRALETGEIWRLGDRRPRKADVRLVSATSKRLDEAVASGLFRQDLLYRINTLILELPPLRERKGDVAALAQTFVREAAGATKRIRPEALALLESHDWPGNVRQLKNVMHRAVVLSGELGEIGPEHILF